MSEIKDDTLSDGEVADEPYDNSSDKQTTAVDNENSQILGISSHESTQLDNVNVGSSSDTKKSKRHDKKDKSHKHKKKHHHRHSNRSELSPSSQKVQDTIDPEGDNLSSHSKHTRKRHHQHSQHSEFKKTARIEPSNLDGIISKRLSMDMEVYGDDSPSGCRDSAKPSQYGYESEEYDEGSDDMRNEPDFYYDSDEGHFGEGPDRDSFGRRGRRGGRRIPEFFPRRPRFGPPGSISRTPCIYFKEGRCGKGDQCTFSHDVPQRTKLELCKFYATTNCLKGPTCLYLHKEFPCKFYHYQGSCKQEGDCLFSHAEMTPVMKALLERFVQEKPFHLKGEDEEEEEQEEVDDEDSDIEQHFPIREQNTNDKCASSLLGPPPPISERTNEHNCHSPTVGPRSRSGPFFPRSSERRALSPDRMMRNEMHDVREDIETTFKKTDSQSKERDSSDYEKFPSRRDESERYYREDDYPIDEEAEDFFYYQQRPLQPRSRMPHIQSQFAGPPSHPYRSFPHPMGPGNSRVPFIPPNAPFRPSYRTGLPPAPPFHPNRNRLSNQHFPANGPMPPRDSILTNAGVSLQRAPSPPEGDRDSPTGVPVGPHSHLLPSPTGPPGMANVSMVSPMIRMNSAAVGPRSIPSGHFRGMHPAMLRHALGPGGPRGGIMPHFLNPTLYRIGSGPGPHPPSSHPLLRGNGNVMNVPTRPLLNQQHFSLPMETEYLSSMENNAGLFPNKISVSDSNNQKKNVASDYSMDMQMLLGGSIDELMQMETSSQPLSSPHSSVTDVSSKVTLELPHRQSSDEIESSQNTQVGGLNEVSADILKKPIPESPKPESDTFILTEPPTFAPQGPIKLLDTPWSLIPLDVPLKVPYPLMQLPTNLPHSHNDPRLRGSLTSGVPSVLRSPPPLASRPPLQSSGGSHGSQSAQQTIATIKLVDPRLNNALSQSHTSTIPDTPLEGQDKPVNGESQVSMMDEQINLSSSSPPPVNQNPVATATLYGKPRLRLTLNENCALFRQTSTCIVSPKSFDSPDASVAAAHSSIDLSSALETQTSDNVTSSPVTSWQASPSANADRSYLLDPRFRRRKTQSLTQQLSDNNSVCSDSTTESDTHSQLTATSLVVPLEMATENAFSDSLTESSNNDLAIHEHL